MREDGPPSMGYGGHDCLPRGKGKRTTVKAIPTLDVKRSRLLLSLGLFKAL